MLKLFLWPLLVVLVSRLNWQYEGLGLELIAFGFFRIFLQASLIFYLPLGVIYWHQQKLANKTVNTWPGLGLGLISFFLAIIGLQFFVTVNGMFGLW